MAACKKCGRTVSYFEIVAGACRQCRGETPFPSTETPDAGDASDLAELKHVTLSTEPIPSQAVVRRFGLVSATCVFGQHLGRDIAGAWRDVLGGRASSIERVFNDAREAALLDLQRAAHDKGANAVFAIQVTHQEMSGGGKSMVMVSAVGTAMLIEPTTSDPSGN